MDLISTSKYHCEYCCCPKDVWKHCMTTYQGDECKLYESFLSLVEDWMTPAILTKVALKELPEEFPDITDIDATVAELVEIALECGVITRPKRSRPCSGSTSG